MKTPNEIRLFSIARIREKEVCAALKRYVPGPWMIISQVEMFEPEFVTLYAQWIGTGVPQPFPVGSLFYAGYNYCSTLNSSLPFNDDSVLLNEKIR